ncbi:SDR family NAD(P)-dependent oxidoreductase [Paenibacillus tengchongensis]|uniref:SDR family NAD(P)-dependent oxidoreductase n=1 Tax=Paenibacillus tengchongensis TaxID=2608684 RepID=UPI00124C470B|nr:glucose 1-dehydrogenase [Paenibacillus tengchongensis]
MRFLDKVVIVTGGAQGIGRATCENFAKEGAKVAIVDFDIEKGTALQEELNKMGFETLFIYADVSKEEDIAAMSDKVYRHFGAIHILVNCAAKGIIKGIDASVEEWQAVFMTNVVGYVTCVKYCLEAMKKNKSSAIVNIASISGFIAQPEYLTYNTSKGAVVNMARCLAMDLAKYNIRVNNVCPGTIWTKNNEFYIGRDYGVNREEADRHPEIGGKHLLQRVGTPEEVAKSVLFLASDDASFITGENLMVDGGYTAKS